MRGSSCVGMASCLEINSLDSQSSHLFKAFFFIVFCDQVELLIASICKAILLWKNVTSIRVLGLRPQAICLGVNQSILSDGFCACLMSFVLVIPLNLELFLHFYFIKTLVVALFLNFNCLFLLSKCSMFAPLITPNE